MVLLRLRVELPTHNHSFCVVASTEETVRELKEEIERTCTGQPRADSQRVIWRGRILEDDEHIEDIWEPEDDNKVTIHLSVRPGGWKSSPPSSSHVPSIQGAPLPATTYTPPSDTHTYISSRPSNAPRSQGPTVCLRYIAQLHQTAIHALAMGHYVPHSLPPEIADARTYTIRYLSILGWSWPEIFDRDYPPQSQPVVVKYEFVNLEGQDYMRLTQPGIPTPVQTHALHVLKHTFPLLFVPALSPSAYLSLLRSLNEQTPNDTMNRNTTERGRPPTQAQQPPANMQQPERVIVWELNLRPLFLPLMAHCLRTVLLLWLFFPAASRQPLIAAAIMGWFFYELWKTVQGALVRLNPPRPGPGGPAPQAGAAGQRPQPGPPGAPAPQGQAPGQAAPPAAGVARHPNVPNHQNIAYPNLFVESLSRLNLADEQAALDGRPHTQPNQGRRLLSFFSLMLLTASPAYWDRRRALLKQREGRIRTELRARQNLNEPLPERGEEVDEATRRANEARQRARAELAAAHERRPAWVRDYVERVARDEWVDE
ncbi:hypothetical protein K488DRAFT_47009 [Vararia minispora EC-137]|uniref:Uncharacterized protein n=1 Tax=Vararia minispora EC-137 TaxID=1314806 RepID=A0ACB8QPW2_9AGAM|nr:hypothetical protein K488DRAFT_47009 [Vararia minispora EC-137]